MRRLLKTARTGQAGSAMILVLIFMALAGLVVPPMLRYMTTGLKTGMIFEKNTKELYAAEAGVNDGLWYVSYSSFDNLFGAAYKMYDYADSWSYSVNGTVNDQPVNVTVQNIWMPENIQPAPPESEARGIIENGKLILTSSTNSTSTYKIDISYYPNAGDALKVQTLGVWLPPGFNYVSGSSNLDTPGKPYTPTSTEVLPWASGHAVIWHFSSLDFEHFGPLAKSSQFPETTTIAFSYTATNPGSTPICIAWMTTSGVADIPYTWDADVKVYRVQATAGGETVAAYATRSEMRQLGSAVKGDYVAIGNVLETATGDVNYRDRLLSSSSATAVTGTGSHQIPSSATVRDAWLYWSGWINDGHPTQVWQDTCSTLSSTSTVWSDDCSTLSSSQNIWSDDCSTFTTSQTAWSDSCGSMTNWSGSDWSVSSGQFAGHHSSGGDRYLTRSADIDLSAYAGKTTTISWSQSTGGTLESDDIFRFSISSDGGSTWSASGSSQTEAFHGGNPASPYTYTIPDNYLTSRFRIRFYLDGFSGSGEYAYIDNISIQAANPIWTADADWSVSSGQFAGHHSGAEADRYLTRAASIDLSSYVGTTTTISWAQTKGGTLGANDGLKFAVSKDGGANWTALMDAFHGNSPTSPFTYTIPADYLTTGFRIKFYLDGVAGTGMYVYIDNISIVATTTYWSSGGAWDIYSGQFRGHYSSGGDAARYLTRGTSIDLSAYAGRTTTISWAQTEAGTLGSGDGLKFAISKDGGANWGNLIDAFHDDNPATPYTYTIPNDYLTSGFRIKFYLDGMSGTGMYAYIDNINIVSQTGPWSPGGDWDTYNGQFRGHHGSGHTDSDRYLTQSSSLDLSAYWGNSVTLSWDQSEGGTLAATDGLKFAISKDGGANWTALMDAFHDDNPDSPFSYTIPAAYLTSQFKIRFYLDQMSGTSQYAYIDDITITTNDWGVNKVVFNGTEVTADKQQVKEDTWMGNPTGTYSYSCSYDATNLVKQMIQNHTLGSNGNGSYTVGHVLRSRPDDPGYSFTLYPSGTTGYPLAVPSSTSGLSDTNKQYSYAGWSLVLIYTSPETQGHQIYLYDDFNFVENDTLDLPVSGFLAPQDPTGSSAAFFVGEGDNGYVGDGVNFNGHALSDAINPANNVWNSYSNLLSSPYINGMDLDGFDVSPYIQPQDTSADIQLYSTMEIYNLVYVILSFRSDTVSSGLITFLIGN